MRVAAFALLGWMSLVGVASAAEWNKVVAGEGRHIDIDRDSILQSDPGTKVAWGRIVMKDDEVEEAGYKIVKALNRYDCREGTFATVMRAYLDVEHRLIREERVVEPNVIRVRPGTVDERLFREVCPPSTGGSLAEVAARAEQVVAQLAVAEGSGPIVLPQIVKPLSDEEKEAAARASAAAQQSREAKPEAAAHKPRPPLTAAAPRRRPPAAPVVPKSAEPPELPHYRTHLQWDYAGPGGPEYWSQLRPEFALCGNGERQSPIDVGEGIRVDLQPIEFAYRPTYFRIEDTGHTVDVAVGEGSSIRVMGRRYDLRRFHFHRPSESRIDGRAFDMEIHLEHEDIDGHQAVVAVMLERGEAHPLVQTLWNSLPLERHQSYVPDVAIDPAELLPEDRRYSIFMGSMTTPPCSEDVLWMVMHAPISLSAGQISIFTRLHPMNARPPQPAAGRLVKRSR